MELGWDTHIWEDDCGYFKKKYVSSGLFLKSIHIAHYPIPNVGVTPDVVEVICFLIYRFNKLKKLYQQTWESK